MIYALDTNIVSYILRREMKVDIRFEQEIINDGNSYVFPPVCVFEIKRWLADNPTREKRDYAKAFEALYQTVRQETSMNADSWEKAAEIYVQLKQSGALIEEADIFIAAYCIVNNYTLVTNNTRHFSRIKNLNCVNWIEMPEC